jgi:Zn-dependent protease with chaperone function
VLLLKPVDPLILGAYGVYTVATLGWPTYLYYRQFHRAPVIDTSQPITDPHIQRSVDVVRNALHELDPERAQTIQLRLQERNDHRNFLEVGPNTIFITRDLAHTVSASEAKGMLAHELGHLQNRDFEKKIYTSGASFLGSSCLWFGLLRRPPSPAAVPLCTVLGWAISSYLRSPFSRKKELRADDQAARMGCSRELARVLDDGVTYDTHSWLDRLFTSDRIFTQHRMKRLRAYESQEDVPTRVSDEQ